MSQHLQELKKELQRLLNERKAEAEALTKYQVRGGGRGPYAASQRSFAAGLAGDFEQHNKNRDQRIAEIQVEIEEAEGSGKKS